LVIGKLFGIHHWHFYDALIYVDNILVTQYIF
jgi:hypothetical protein